MDEQLVVAVYATEERAKAAMRDLREAGVPENAIDRHAREDSTLVDHDDHKKDGKDDKPSFWQRLFGSSNDHDTSDYDRNVEKGAIVVAVRVKTADVDKIEALLEKHDPIDLDEQHAGVAGPGAGMGSAGAGAAAGTGAAATAGTATGDHKAGHTGHADREETMQLSEEEMKIGKRDVNHGTTRVRRHVVETPVEEDVHLRDEEVSVERRPVTGDRHVTDADFTDKSVEMTETDEEAVVAKEAHVREEVALRKDVGEHTEHVSDSVRHHELDVDKTGDTSRHGDTPRPDSDRHDPKKR